MLFIKFQHTAARRRLHKPNVGLDLSESFNTQPRGGGCQIHLWCQYRQSVSTHSRAEAAARDSCVVAVAILGFNTQPRGGGCVFGKFFTGWYGGVSTHSRAEAAAKITAQELREMAVSTHSRAEAAALFESGIIASLLFQHTAARRRLPVHLSFKSCG